MIAKDDQALCHGSAGPNTSSNVSTMVMQYGASEGGSNSAVSNVAANVLCVVSFRHQTASINQVDARHHSGSQTVATQLSQYIGEEDQRIIDTYAEEWHLL